MDQARAPVPVTILTGDLGAGKTTLLNHILAEMKGKNYAVIINEYGKIGIDNKLVEAVDSGEPILIGDGLICCKVRGDLIATVKRILARPGKLDGIIIETSGLANPIPVVRTFFSEDGMPEQAKIDAVVTVIDAQHFMGSLTKNLETTEQVLIADVVILNKSRLVSPSMLAAVKDRIRQLNPVAVVLQEDAATVPVSQILDRGAFDTTRALKIIAEARGPATRYDRNDYSATVEIEQPLDMEKFQKWLLDFAQTHGPDVRRYKGILSGSKSDNRLIIHGVHAEVHGGIAEGKPWLPGERRFSIMVFIGENLNQAALEAGIRSCAVASVPQQSALYSGGYKVGVTTLANVQGRPPAGSYQPYKPYKRPGSP